MLSQVRICRTHPPSSLRSGHIYMKDAHSVESIEKLYIRFFRFSFFKLWLIAFTIYDDTPGVPPTKIKMLFKSGQIYREDAVWSDKDFLVHEFFVMRLKVFEIWSIYVTWSTWSIAPLLVGDTPCSCMQNRPYLQNWKAHKNKLMDKKK